MPILTTATKQIPTTEGALIKRGKKGFRGTPGGFDARAENDICKEFVRGSGQYVLLPKGTRLLNAVCTLLTEDMQKPLVFEEVVLPKIAPVKTFRKAGITGNWDDYLIVVRPFSSTKGVREEYLMDPLQCTTFYQIFEGNVIEPSSLPVKWFDCSGPTYRNEDSDKIVPLVKQREFHRAEFIYLGTKAQTIQIREECLARLERLCVDLGLEYRIVVGSGCYEIKPGELGPPQTLDEIPVKDLEIYCPGYRNGSSFLEVAGSAVLSTILTSRFSITGQNCTALWSGCTGIGLERMMFALLTNYGADFEKFPGKIREVME
ncbi:MAG: aminoacyl--tRNA ligase-related protein [Candidatus Micrarchaeota archaeon]